jgi:hypothetical protein
LKHIPENKRTFDFCLAAMEGGGCISDVPETVMTHDLCMVYLKKKLKLHKGKRQDNLIDLIPQSMCTPKLYDEAVKVNGWVLEHIPKEKRTPAICMAAVQQNPAMLHAVPNSERNNFLLCKTAVQGCGGRLLFVPKALIIEHPELCMLAVSQDGAALNYVPDSMRDPKICEVAVKQNGLAIQYVPKELLTPALYLAAVQQNGKVLKEIPLNMRSPEILLAAVEQFPELLNDIPSEQRTFEMYVAAVEQDALFLEKISDDAMKERVINHVTVESILASNYLALK